MKRCLEIFRSWRAALASGIRNLYSRLVPGDSNRRGISRALFLAALGLAALNFYRLGSGYGRMVDLAIGVGVGLLFFGLADLLWKLTPWLIGELPRWLDRSGLAAATVIVIALTGFGLPLLPLIKASVLVILAAAAIGGFSAWIATGGWRTSSGFKRTLAVTGILGVVVLSVVTVRFLGSEGTTDHLLDPPDSVELAKSEIFRDPDLPDDPAERGSHEVQYLTYGSGSDRHRPEFGNEVAVISKTVDATPFTTGYSGWKRKLRDRYWDFEPDAYPLNGRVWMPEGEGPFPLVLIVHGNHHMAEFSDPGYEYLGELLASRGIITVSVDENFLNGSYFGGVPRENDARGWLLLKHLEQWREWSEDGEHRFAGKVDLARLGLVGHSRGGEAAAIAAAFNRLPFYPDDATVPFDFGFDLNAVIAIAPSDGQYRPADRRTPLTDVSYLVFQGGHDGDVSLFLGDRQYRRVKLTRPDRFKASVYLYRANHGQFNTRWGRHDLGMPRSWFLNTAPLIEPEAQRRSAEVLISGFLEATLRDRGEYRQLFRQPERLRSLLPRDHVVTRYEDADFRLLADFEEDVDVTSGSVPGVSMRADGLTLWKEADIPLRDGVTRDDNGVFLGWRSADKGPDGEKGNVSDSVVEAPVYSISLPADGPRPWNLVRETNLVFHLAEAPGEPPQGKNDDEADPDDENAELEPEEETASEGSTETGQPLDLSLELVDSEGRVASLGLAEASSHGGLPPLLPMRFSKLDAIERKNYGTEPESVFQTFEIPLAAFQQVTPDLALDALTEIRFRFDRSPQGIVVLDRVGWTGALAAEE